MKEKKSSMQIDRMETISKRIAMNEMKLEQNNNSKFEQNENGSKRFDRKTLRSKH